MAMPPRGAPGREREPPELKHLSRGRRRNQPGCPEYRRGKGAELKPNSRSRERVDVGLRGDREPLGGKPKWPGTARHRG